MTFVMYDDAVADGWAPFALTRPCGELRFGRWTLRRRVENVLGVRVSAHVSRSWLSSYSEAGAPPVVDPSTVPAAAAFWCARAVPAKAAALPSEPGNLWVDGRFAGVLTAPDEETPDSAWFASPSPLPGLGDHQLPGAWLDQPWDLVSKGPERLAEDLAASVQGTTEAPEGCWVLGSGPIRLGAGVRIEPGSLFDTRAGAIELADDVEVRHGTRLAGPVYVGEHSRLLGGSVSAFSGGPYCTVRGEIEEVTALGYVNKAHDGFLGHAYLGRWVNLGAMTTNSDLKNNYGSIRVGPPEALVDTELVKLGCLIGDHAKTGIGVLLNTGTIVGAGSNLYGAELPPKWVKPFSWGQGEDLVETRRDAFLATAAKVVVRRGVEPDEAFMRWLGDVWDAARATDRSPATDR